MALSVSRRRVTVWVFVGALLMQAAWVLSLPPFRGIDEFDHAYRAAAVAHGQLMAEPSDATRGTGAMLAVPRDIVLAASPVCRSLPYTNAVDCTPQADLGEGFVAVASGAGRYNPAFYWAVGTPARGADGAAAVYVMRAVTAVLCAALLALAAWAVMQWARTRWPLVALMLSMTPVAVYSTAVAAPNGPEICAAAALWCSLLGLTLKGGARQRRRLLLSAVPSITILATVRSLGPLWLFLTISAVGLLAGREGIRRVWKGDRAGVIVSTMTAAVTTAASVGWILAMRSLVIGTDPTLANADLSTSLRQAVNSIPVWILQSIAAFPTRNEQAPTVVYAALIVIGGLFLAGAVRASRRHRRVRLTMVLALAVTVLVPLGLTTATYDQFGVAWQGRYGLPVSIGVVLIGGLALDVARPRSRLISPALAAGGILVGVAHVVSPLSVILEEVRTSPLAGHPAWIMPAPWHVALLAGLGWLCWLQGIRVAAARGTTSFGSNATPTPELVSK